MSARSGEGGTPSCTIWYIDVERAEGAFPRGSGPLATRQLVARRKALTRSLLLGALSEETGTTFLPCDLVRICFCGKTHGKPRVRAYPNLDFSVSHSGRVIAVAVARYGRVGLDVEDLSRLRGEPSAYLTQMMADAALCPNVSHVKSWLEVCERWVRWEAQLKFGGLCPEVVWKASERNEQGPDVRISVTHLQTVFGGDCIGAIALEPEFDQVVEERDGMQLLNQFGP